MAGGLFRLDSPETNFNRRADRSLPDCEVHLAWPWHERIASALTRRAYAWWQRVRSRGQLPHPEAAVAWLHQQNRGMGLASSADGKPCPGTTAAILPTLLDYGQLELVRPWSKWLLSTQLPDGAFPHAEAHCSSRFNTAQALEALVKLAAAGELCDLHPARRAADWLAARLAVIGECPEGEKHQVRLAAALRCLPGLSAAAHDMAVPDWQIVVDRIATIARSSFGGQSSRRARRVALNVAEGWLAIAEFARAQGALSGFSPVQWRGAIRCTNHAHAAELAHLAALWYRLGQRREADRALSVFLGFRLAARQSGWGVKHYLDAVRWQVASAFGDEPSALPHAIAAHDGRWLAVDRWMSSLDQAAKVADVGCGSGRFLRQLAHRYPTARLVGIDPAASFLQLLPNGVEARRGGMLRLPAADHEFDGAIAVESLEHSLLPQKAIQELCRVVRPGGRLLIIDKHAARQPLSSHQPWERWFLPETVASGMAPYCGDISMRPIAHGTHTEPDGLFVCWEATRCEQRMSA